MFISVIDAYDLGAMSDMTKQGCSANIVGPPIFRGMAASFANALPGPRVTRLPPNRRKKPRRVALFPRANQGAENRPPVSPAVARAPRAATQPPCRQAA